MGFEPTTSGATDRRSARLSYKGDSMGGVLRTVFMPPYSRGAPPPARRQRGQTDSTPQTMRRATAPGRLAVCFVDFRVGPGGPPADAASGDANSPATGIDRAGQGDRHPRGGPRARVAGRPIGDRPV